MPVNTPVSKTAKLRLLVSRCGHSPSGTSFSQSPGQEIEVETGEAWRMVDAGQAEFVGAKPKRPKPDGSDDDSDE